MPTTYAYKVRDRAGKLRSPSGRQGPRLGPAANREALRSAQAEALGVLVHRRRPAQLVAEQVERLEEGEQAHSPPRLARRVRHLSHIGDNPRP